MYYRCFGVFAFFGIFFILLPVSSKASSCASNDDKLMVYEHFKNAGGGVSGLTAMTDGFYLANKKVKIISGAMHYFRIHPELWRDRLKKLRAVGANTVETYVPWNLHEPRMGEFDFGDGDNDMSMFLDLTKFIQMAQEEDLLMLLRPGPYICAEWEFGGLPSWLQRDPTMRVRTNHTFYMERVKIYFDTLLPIVSDLQFTKGGPIIGIQIENEYGSFNAVSTEYLEFLYQIFVDQGFANETLLFTSDPASVGRRGTLPDKLLHTVNFQMDASANIRRLKQLQPNKTLMVAEFWSGWFDHWGEKHHIVKPGAFVDGINEIIGVWNASINIYMFHGGTNFGFMAGANAKNKAPFRDADITSYDYDAPLSEAGDYTVKYRLAQTLIEMYSQPKIKKTAMPPESVKKAYETTAMKQYLTYADIIERLPDSAKFEAESPMTMEELPMNADSGQSYGYIIYRKVIEVFDNIVFHIGPVKDLGMVLVDGRPLQINRVGPNYILVLNNMSINLTLSRANVTSAKNHTFDVFVENTGRLNVGYDHQLIQRKGLANGTFKINGADVTDIEIFALEFKSAWVKSLTDWKDITDPATLKAPILLQTIIDIDEPADTFLDMSAWTKGIVFINGFNIGRYFKVGPQRTLYIPGPLLTKGSNIISIFEQIKPSSHIVFSSTPRLM